MELVLSAVRRIWLIRLFIGWFVCLLVGWLVKYSNDEILCHTHGKK